MEESSAYNYLRYKFDFLRKGRSKYPYNRASYNNTLSSVMMYSVGEPSIYIKETAVRCL